MTILTLSVLVALLPAPVMPQAVTPPASTVTAAAAPDKPSAPAPITTPAPQPSSVSNAAAAADESSSSTLPDRPSVRSASLNDDAEALRSLRVPEKPSGPRGSIPEAQRDGRKRIWLGLAMAQHGAAAFDAYATREAVSSGRGRELDPLLRPFAGSAALYPAMQVGPALLDYVGLRMMNNRRAWVRHIWWVPQTFATAGFLWAGSHNLSMARQSLPGSAR
jgi:hypothetical protein